MKKITWKALLICWIFTICLSFNLFAASSSEIKALYDNYISCHKEYLDAYNAGADEQNVKSLALKLQQAQVNYYKALGVNTTTSVTVPDATTNDSVATMKLKLRM